jgi:regulator of replication initiation timing
MLSWLFGKNPNQRLRKLTQEIETIDAQIAVNTEAIAQKKIELQHLKDSIGRYKKALKKEEN